MQHVTYYTASLFISQKLSQSAEAVYEKQSMPHDTLACRNTFNSNKIK